MPHFHRSAGPRLLEEPRLPVLVEAATPVFQRTFDDPDSRVVTIEQDTRYPDLQPPAYLQLPTGTLSPFGNGVPVGVKSIHTGRLRDAGRPIGEILMLRSPDGGV